MTDIDMVYILRAICETNQELVEDGIAEYDENCKIADDVFNVILSQE